MYPNSPAHRAAVTMITIAVTVVTGKVLLGHKVTDFGDMAFVGMTKGVLQTALPKSLTGCSGKGGDTYFRRDEFCARLYYT